MLTHWYSVRTRRGRYGDALERVPRWHAGRNELSTRREADERHRLLRGTLEHSRWTAGRRDSIATRLPPSPDRFWNAIAIVAASGLHAPPNS